MWIVLYILLGILAGIAVTAIITLLLRAVFGGGRQQSITATEVAAVVAPAPVPVYDTPVAAGSVAVEKTEPVTDIVELFLLSRQDVIDRVDAMRENAERFLLAPSLKERETENLPDYIKCGEICFSIVFELNDCVHNIAVRLDAATATALGEEHPVEHAGYLSGDDWYNLVIDQSYKGKREVYRILDASYDYVFRMNGQITEDEAKAELTHIEEEYATNTAEVEKLALAAEQNYLAALEKFKAEHYTEFSITCKEIIADTLALSDKNITLLERAEPQMPVSLKYKNKTYAILYGTDRGVMMVVKLSDIFADRLAVRHPEIRRAKFPAGANWYYIPVDGAFDGKESVYKVLNASYGYVLVKYGTQTEIEKAPKLLYADFSANKEEEEIDNTGGYTREGIIKYTLGLNNPGITIIDRPMEPQLPVSLKFEGKTYAMVYGTEKGVVMIIKLSNDYAEKLKENHDDIAKAKFPAGPNWFSVPLTNSFTQEQVHNVLNNGVQFVTASKVKKQKETQVKTGEKAKAKETKPKKVTAGGVKTKESQPKETKPKSPAVKKSPYASQKKS